VHLVLLLRSKLTAAKLLHVATETITIRPPVTTSKLSVCLSAFADRTERRNSSLNQLTARFHMPIFRLFAV
jgi:hypothetical protein